MASLAGQPQVAVEDDRTVRGVTEMLGREVDILESNVSALFDKLAPYLNVPENVPGASGQSDKDSVRATGVFDLLTQTKRIGEIAYSLRQALLRLAL